MFLLFIISIFLYSAQTQRLLDCNVGRKIAFLQNVQVRRNNMERFVAISRCNEFEPRKCTHKCSWAQSCRLSPAWNQFKGERTYIANARTDKNGKIELYCCSSLAFYVRNCKFTEPSKTTRLVQLSNYNKPRVKKNLIIRDVLTEWKNKIMYSSVELCTAIRERRYCDMNQLRGVQQRIFGAMLVRSNRIGVLRKPNPQKQEVQVEVLKKKIFGLNPPTKKNKPRTKSTTIKTTTTTTTTTTTPETTTTTHTTEATKATKSESVMADATQWRNEESSEETDESDYYDIVTDSSYELVSDSYEDESSEEDDCQDDHHIQETCPKPDYTPCVSDEEAESQLQKCCHKRNVSLGCHALCSYNTTPTQIFDAFITKKCELGQKDVIICSAASNDVTDCCRHKNVLGKNNLCQPFCDPASGDIDFGNIKYFSCAKYSQQISQCFKAYLQPAKKKCQKKSQEDEKTRENRNNRNNQCPKPPRFEPCLSTDQANEKFQSCCSKSIPGCLDLCRYNITPMHAFSIMRRGTCSMTDITDVMTCASNKNDVTKCCIEKRVPNNCLPLCNPPETRVDFTDESQRNCVSAAYRIAHCFMAYLN